MLLRLALLVMPVVLLAACGDGGPSTATPGAGQPDGMLLPLVATFVATAMLTPGGDATFVPDETLAPVVAAREDLAARFERALDEVEVVSVRREQWPDSCLGVTYIGQEDEVCAQVITPGYEVVLRLEPNEYTYRTDEAGNTVRFAGVDVFAD